MPEFSPVCCLDVLVEDCFGKSLGEDVPAVWVDFAESPEMEVELDSGEGKTDPNPATEVELIEHL